MVDSDLQKLCVSGEATAEQLAQAWAALFYEYCDLVEASEAKNKINKLTEITLLSQKITLAKSWLAILEVMPSDNLSKAMQIIGFDFYFKENIANDIARCRAMLSSLNLDLQLKQDYYQAVFSKSTTVDSVDRKYFATVFTRLNSYYKYNAVNMQSTVEMYCAALRDYADYVEQNKNNK